MERYNGSFKRECLQIFQPQTLERVKEATAQYKAHYNNERPHQGRSCKNQPPKVAFKELPALPTLPLIVDPDRWLLGVEQARFTRKVKRDGSITVDKYNYWVGQGLAGKYVVVKVAGSKRELVVEHKGKEVKRLAIKGIYGQEMSLKQYREAIMAEARSEKRGWRGRKAS